MGANGLTPFKTKEFQLIHEEWMEILKEEGFQEIEDLNSPHEMLRKWHSHWFQESFSSQEFEARRIYFEKCQGLLLTFEFTCLLEKQVWECHSEGMSLREIARKLRTKANALNKDKAAAFIRRIRKDAWGFD